jgi:uncharacterized membrane protein YfcA
VPESLELAVLVVAGFVAGYVNTIAGAGSLLTLPALIFTGLDASAANATNRIAVVVQSLAAILAYRRSGIRVGGFAARAFAPAGVAAALGAWVASRLDEGTLEVAIAIAMGVFLVLSLVPPKRAKEETGGAGELPPFSIPLSVGFFFIGFYAGFLQAGVGILVLLYLAHGHGTDLVTANAAKVALVLGVSVVSLVVFAASDVAIDPVRGGLLALSTAVGGYLGARATLRRGQRLIRLAMVVAVLASIAKLAFDAL